MGSGKILVDETAVASADDAGWLRRHVAALPRPLRFLCVGAAGLTTDLIVFTAIPLHAQHPLAARIVSLAAATFVTWRLNRELTFERSGRSQHREALRYGAVTAISQGASFIVFSSLVMTALGTHAAARLAGRSRCRSSHRLYGPRLVCIPSACSRRHGWGTKHMNADADVFVIGAGPAGLTAAYCLTKENPSVIVREGPGLCRRHQPHGRIQGFMFDIGGHRFFSKSKEVVDLWQEILPDDFIERPRLSRIYYGGKYYSYPLERLRGAVQSRHLHQRGLHAVLRLRASCCRSEPAELPRMGAQPVRRKAVLDLLQDLHREGVGHVVRRDFRRLGGAAHQGLDLGVAVCNALKKALLPARKPKAGEPVVKTLIESFQYPRKGPGMMWEAAARKIQKRGGKVLKGRELDAARL